MKLYVIFLQRKEQYTGQYGIEAVEVMDEYSYEENPDYLTTELKELNNQLNTQKAEIVVVNINEEEVRDILCHQKEIKGII
jgi:ATP-dependent RNA circularization protein (DNA/RNA ligase family)